MSCKTILKLIYRSRFGWTANVGETSGGRMERHGRRRVIDMLGTGVTSNDRGHSLSDGSVQLVSERLQWQAT